MKPCSSSQTLKLTYHSIGPKPWSLMSKSEASAGSFVVDRPDAPVERLPELDQPGTKRRQLLLSAAGRPVCQVPDVPQLVPKPIGGHQVEDEQVPLAPLHQELDGLQVLVQKRRQVVDHRGLVAAVMNGRGPGPVRADHSLQLGEKRGIGREIGGFSGLRKSPR